MKSYIHLLSRIYNTPLFISRSKFDIISSNVGVKLLQGESPTGDGSFAQERKEVRASDIPIINVFGVLEGKRTPGESGTTTYMDIINQTRSLASAGHKLLGFYVDSPGGEGSGLFGAAKFIGDLKNRGIKTFAFTDGDMTSAAYILLSGVDTIYAENSAIVGSLAAMMDIVNIHELESNEGIKHTILRSKDGKQSVNPHEPQTEEGILKMQNLLAELDSVLNETVASNRPSLTKDAIIGMNGEIFIASKAKDLGLVDKLVSTLDQAVAIELSALKSKPKGITMENETEALETLKASFKEKENSYKLQIAEAAKLERERCLGILKAAETFKLSTDKAIKRIEANTSLEDSTEIFTAIAEAIGETTKIETSAEIKETLSEDVASEKVTVLGQKFSKAELLEAGKAFAKK